MNPDVATTLEEAVGEVLSLITGLDLDYDPNQDRFRQVVRCLNRATRLNALENEWDYYSSTEQLGFVHPGVTQVPMRNTIRPRIISDDAVRLVDPDGIVRVWAYFLPRDAIHKYRGRQGLWAAPHHNTLIFSRPFLDREEGYMIEVPVMREPVMLELPPLPKTPAGPILPVPDALLQQPIDFDYPDAIIARAAFLFSLSDPLLQPRAQQLESDWKSVMYSLVERDTRATDSPYQNEIIVPVSDSIYPDPPPWTHQHPHSDTGSYW